MHSPYEPNEAQIRNLMRFTGASMGEASRALVEGAGFWNAAVEILEAARQSRTTRRSTTPKKEIARA